MRAIPNLELHVAHACNLSCESCSHYSNHAHGGVVALEDARRWMASWNSRVRPKVLTLLGGEPTIHPGLPGFVDLAAEHWPGVRLRLVTNGFFLHRHPELPLALKRHGNAYLSLSIHHDDPSYLERVAPIM